MVKKKSNISRNLSKNANNRSGVGCFKKIIFRYKFVFILLIIVVGFLGYKYTAIYLEKRSFLAKEKKLEQLADKIANQYPPDSKSSEKYCRYSHQKISRGDLSCTSILKSVYYVGNEHKATDMKNAIVKTLGVRSREVSANKLGSDGFVYSTEKQYWNSFIGEFNDPSGCLIYFNYLDSQFVIDFECNIYNPKSEIFPVEE